MILKGQEGDNSYPDSRSFQFAVHSCPTMNLIRESLNEPTINCKDDAVIKSAINNISVASKVIYRFFDPQQINETGDLDIASHYSNTTIIKTFGQVKRLYITEITSTFANALWYDMPFKELPRYKNYKVEQTDLTIGDIEATAAGTGYVNFRYTQGPVRYEDTFKRQTIASLLWVIGGFLSLITRLSNLILASY